MSLPDKRIVSFINNHHVLTLATCNDEEPYCANCFYVYMEEDNSLVFTSDFDTKHIRQVSHNVYVAGSIVLETEIIGKLRGIQLQGIVSEARDELYTKARAAYLKRFPVAMLMKTTLWVIDLTFLKFTDNTLGFGKKLIWEKELIVNPFFSKENS
ncbi:MAG TPA: pyridoxamine 5'-phosphate oxidase family protein [Perlabentimonas sp.]|nr:pyridoxamine 5'-phosphate oxidase family protein [Tenuifilaceae bacterium]HZJ74123.1 pyridoxamine 5'-phosphate oxidase family protein [Perlabentimonas sp.]